jgi:hypothetical protein
MVGTRRAEQLGDHISSATTFVVACWLTAFQQVAQVIKLLVLARVIGGKLQAVILGSYSLV